MGIEKTMQSVLRLDRILFDKIEFKRLGISSEKELEVALVQHCLNISD